MKANLAGRVGMLQTTAVNRVLAEVRKLQKEGRSVVSLMRGQPDTSTPLPVVEAAQKALRDGRTGYPDNQGEPELRQAVAEKLLRDNGLTYDPDGEILISDGATGGLCTALGTLIQPGDDVLVPEPIYDAYASPIALWGGRPVQAAASLREGRFVVERSALEAACTPRTRLLLVNTPWNPVGTVFTRRELEEIMSFAAERDLLVLSDEIYEALIYDGKRHVAPAALSEDARCRTVVINSLSKTYGMTGWRVGYCAAPAPLIQAMLLVWQQFSRGPATFVQDAAACALRLDPSWICQLAAAYQERRDQVVLRLRHLARCTPLAAEGGLFVMLDVRGLGLTSEEVRRFLLHEAGVAVLHGSAYGPTGEGMLRISFAAGGKTLAEGLDRLYRGLLSLESART